MSRWAFMAVSINATYDHDHGRDIIPIGTTEKGMYTELEKGKYNVVMFARDKTQPNLARVKFLLCNNSKRLVDWTIKGVSENIQAIPKASGLIKAFDTGECTLIWRRPNDYNSWREQPPLKMLLQIKSMVSERGKVMGKAYDKFRVVVDPNLMCTVDEPPIHKIVLNSKPATMILLKKNSKAKTDSNAGMQTEIGGKNVLDDSQRINYILLLLLSLLITYLLKIFYQQK
ncbi:unnamed protein product [Litomosoides sigmodontis]|uniref:Uncharacterized protein n=1 Tax=Litomosoides sigmodontis TaxID=42156 RepID=A0A3P6T6Z3_LITSI|nr:unnamed protein product [Litomosoides sigmodontis]